MDSVFISDNNMVMSPYKSKFKSAKYKNMFDIVGLHTKLSLLLQFK